MRIKLFTIGFTKKTAARFFGLIRQAGVTSVIDTRLNRKSQLAGFAKEQDLQFLIPEICQAAYKTEPLLAPTEPILTGFKKKEINWEEYEKEYLNLIELRQVGSRLDRDAFDGACLLCSEDKPHFCHRRLAAEYLAAQWKDVEIHHL